MNYHKIIRILQKIGLKFYRLGNQYDKSEKSDYEHECIGICKSLIKDERTKLMMSPISRKRYLNSHDKQIFIIIENYTMIIVNHQYSYTIDLPSKSYIRITSMFDEEMEKRRLAMEREIKSNVKHSLKNIYQNLVNEKV